VFYPYFVGESRMEFWGPAIFTLQGEHDVIHAAHNVPSWVPLSPLVVALSGIFLAYMSYMFFTGIPALVARALKPIHALFYNKWYVDELYEALFVKPSLQLGQFFYRAGDQAVINGLGPDGLTALSRAGAGALSRMQSGYMYHYALMMIVSVVGLVGWLLLKLKGFI